MPSWMEKLFHAPLNETVVPKATIHDEEKTLRILRRARRAEKEFDIEFNKLMEQLDSIKRDQAEEGSDNG